MSTEQPQPLPDKRLLRAARSLYTNRQKQAIIESRIDRAATEINTFMGLYGIATAAIGSYDVQLEDGEVHVAYRPSPDAAQLPLPNYETGPHRDPLAASAPPSFTRLADPPTTRHAVAEAPAMYVSQVSFLTPEDATLLHELRRMVGEVSRIYSDTRRDRAGERLRFTQPAMVFEYLRGEMEHLSQEQLRVLNLTLKHDLITAPLVYQGTISSSPIRVAEVFRPAIMDGAAAIIIAHNHPSGDPTPSPDDIRTTRQLTEAGKLFDIELLDHIIIGDGRFVSLREMGCM